MNEVNRLRHLQKHHVSYLLSIKKTHSDTKPKSKKRWNVDAKSYRKDIDSDSAHLCVDRPMKPRNCSYSALINAYLLSGTDFGAFKFKGRRGNQS